MHACISNIVRLTTICKYATLINCRSDGLLKLKYSLLLSSLYYKLYMRLTQQQQQQQQDPLLKYYYVYQLWPRMLPATTIRTPICVKYCKHGNEKSFQFSSIGKTWGHKQFSQNRHSLTTATTIRQQMRTTTTTTSSSNNIKMATEMLNYCRQYIP